ncbi:MAG: hypothetical protein ACK4EX_04595 [Thermaurantimonas sp.]|uniref:hypothetical protein n=1 Tax=Thermaurantimonas sp. TaxID=2681568 RepID=UPI00391DFA9C
MKPAISLLFLLLHTLPSAQHLTQTESTFSLPYKPLTIVHDSSNGARKLPSFNPNSNIGFTYRSNYYKNVPVEERTKDDHLHQRSYVQTTSGAIYYYDEIYRMGRRY